MVRRNLLTIASAVLLIILATTGADAGRVLLICNKDLWNQSNCQTGISIYANNLVDDGYTIVENSNHYGTIPNFSSSGNVLLVAKHDESGGYLNNPTDLRGYIKARYDESGSLVGCVLVGDVAIPYWEYKDNEGTWHWYPLDIAYMDMDGTWTDSDNNGKFDSRSGDYQNSEIWVGRITASRLVKTNATDTAHPYWYGGSKLATEAKIVRNYFERNDAYREGTLTRPHKALIYNDDEQICDGTNGVDYLYSNYLIVGNAEGTEDNTTTAADYANRLGQDYEWVHNHSHGEPTHTCFHTPGDGGGWGGGSLVGWINVSAPTPKYSIAGDSPDVQPKPLFYFADNCHTARYDKDNYLGGCYLFHPTVTDRYGLVTIGHAKKSYARDEVPFYDKLFKRKTIGEAFIESNKTGSYADPGLSIFSDGMTILGDPTLRVGMGHSVASFQVPSQYSTIQSAVDAAYSAGGGIVYVSPGTYEEQVTMKNGVCLVGVSSGTKTINGGSGYGAVAVSFNNVTNSRVTGFTLSGFVAIDCDNYSTPTLDHNTINNNTYGIFCGYSSPAIHYNTFTDNETGLSLQYSSDPEMRNGYNVITQNTGLRGIYCYDLSEPKLGKYQAAHPTSQGRNEFHASGSAYHIYASSNCGTIWAQKNLWDPEDATKIYHGGSDP
ncbi:MAG: hypothetical protein B1H40_01670 [Candidatus Latescibacteria bacterium 4484_181]|nr:MAG: hypothetical protein B1H40_01670 [Candidatus Latescibacteria bacterium 4484_181]RKY71387.1 MAG: hypothetical protein DRQ24_07475 [Candidatus Latescibacterota bacterium]